MTTLVQVLGRYGANQHLLEVPQDWNAMLNGAGLDLTGPIGQVVQESVVRGDLKGSISLLLADSLVELESKPTRASVLCYEACLFEKLTVEHLSEVGLVLLRRSRVSPLPLCVHDLETFMFTSRTGDEFTFESELSEFAGDSPFWEWDSSLVVLAARAFGLAWLLLKTAPELDDITFLQGAIVLDGLASAFEALADLEALELIRAEFVSWGKVDGYSIDDFLEPDDYSLTWRLAHLDAFVKGLKAGLSIGRVSAIPSVQQYSSGIRDHLTELKVIRDMIAAVGIRQIKESQVLKERLQATVEETREDLRELLGDTWAQFPRAVIDLLTKAERRYRRQLDGDEAKVLFCKAVEASVRDCIVEPLLDYMSQNGQSKIRVPFERKPAENLTPSSLKKLSLRDWAEALRVLNQLTGMQQLVGNDLKRYFASGAPDLDLGCLPEIGNALEEIQNLRAGSAHFEEPLSRIEQEEHQLERLRDAVLGRGRESVLTQLYALFGKPAAETN